MHEALFYKKYDDQKVRCQLCPHKCVISPGKKGICRVRENQNGILVALVYGKPCSINVDPIEKKPLFHFMPGSKAFSVGTAGCNLSCQWCQNWNTSQAGPTETVMHRLTPEEVVEKAIEHGCKTIAYTYNEPSIFFEYVLDCAKLAREKGLKNMMVTNGFINKKPAQELYQYIDAANVDLKGFSEDLYRKYCFGELKPVLDTLKLLKQMNVWLEVTNLIVPSLNDDFSLIGKMCEWIKENLGTDIPMHFSKFYPNYKLTHIPPTPEKTLIQAKDLAKTVGMKYVYVGNTSLPGLEDTKCFQCKKVLIKRTAFQVRENHIESLQCKFCNSLVKGVWI